jgi:hypothetical protein
MVSKKIEDKRIMDSNFRWNGRLWLEWKVVAGMEGQRWNGR